MIPGAYYIWRRWKLEGGTRPSSLPTRIPPATLTRWYVRLAAYRALLRPPASISSVIPPVFQRYVFAGVLSNFTGPERQKAWDRGYRTILVQLGDGSAASDANDQELYERGVVYRAEGWRIAGWCDPASLYPETGARVARSWVDEHSLDGWVTDWEMWGEGTFVGLPGRWLAEWQRLGVKVPLGLSCLSSENDQWPRPFDYKPWVEFGATIMPQVYGDAHAGYTVHNMKRVMSLGGVPKYLLSPTFGAVEALDPYSDYATWDGPHGVWIAGQVRDWSKL